jgi:hypothetical protein
MLEMLEVLDVRSDAYSQASKRALFAQAELTRLKHEIEAHFRAHKCDCRVIGWSWKRSAFADMPLHALETEEGT